MRPHQGNGFVGKAFGQSDALVVVGHQHIGRAVIFGDVKDRHALRQEGRVVKARLHRRFGEAEGDDRRRVTVNHRADIGPRGVDLPVNKAFEEALRSIRVACFAIKVILDDVVGRHQRRCQGARHQIALRCIRVTHRNMAKSIDNAPRCKDTGRRCDISNALGRDRASAGGHQMITLVATLAGKMSSGVNW